MYINSLEYEQQKNVNQQEWYNKITKYTIIQNTNISQVDDNDFSAI